MRLRVGQLTTNLVLIRPDLLPWGESQYRIRTGCNDELGVASGWSEGTALKQFGQGTPGRFSSQRLSRA